MSRQCMYRDNYKDLHCSGCKHIVNTNDSKAIYANIEDLVYSIVITSLQKSKANKVLTALVIDYLKNLGIKGKSHD